MNATAPAKQSASQARSLHDRIQERAYELYKQRGEQPGHDVDDWLQAEAEIRRVEDALVDEASRESFPASDSPAY